MSRPPIDPASALALAVSAYREGNDYGVLLERLRAVCEQVPIEALVGAAEAYREIPEVAGPIYEYVVAHRPDDARALVILGNAYWLTGRGSEAAGEMASRAIAADPSSRGAWHLWAIAERTPRERMTRWKQVVERFPSDDLARANLGDIAASVGATEHDREARQLAIRCFEHLERTATRMEQKAALGKALETLRSWRE
ncbi:MAG TPA: tetratricopeptide repeat protein [Gemmatimonadaceae bacterium]|nr:tetratricopeptide repeat protein [Gemmatimonadaceae bacterium]